MAPENLPPYLRNANKSATQAKQSINLKGKYGQV